MSSHGSDERSSARLPVAFCGPDALRLLESRAHERERAERERALLAALGRENAERASLVRLDAELQRDRRDRDDEPERRQAAQLRGAVFIALGSCTVVVGEAAREDHRHAENGRRARRRSRARADKRTAEIAGDRRRLRRREPSAGARVEILDVQRVDRRVEHPAHERLLRVRLIFHRQPLLRRRCRRRRCRDACVTFGSIAGLAACVVNVISSPAACAGETDAVLDRAARLESAARDAARVRPRGPPPI